MLNCDNGTYDAWYWAHPPVYMPENCNLEDVEHIKQFVRIPVVCAGRMNPKQRQNRSPQEDWTERDSRGSFGRSGMGHKDDGRSGRRDSALYFMP